MDVAERIKTAESGKDAMIIGQKVEEDKALVNEKVRSCELH